MYVFTCVLRYAQPCLSVCNASDSSSSSVRSAKTAPSLSLLLFFFLSSSSSSSSSSSLVLLFFFQNKKMPAPPRPSAYGTTTGAGSLQRLELGREGRKAIWDNRRKSVEKKKRKRGRIRYIYTHRHCQAQPMWPSFVNLVRLFQNNGNISE